MEFTLPFSEDQLKEFVTGLNNYPYPGKPADYAYDYEILKTKIRINGKYTRDLHNNSEAPYYCESVWGFIDNIGGIWYPATYNRVAKHIRGNVFKADPYKEHNWTGPRTLR